MVDRAQDDRAAFAAEQLEHGREIASDPKLQRAALDVMAQSDRLHWSYTWRWLGLPIIQVPTDIVAAQEVIWETRPTVIVETGVARGGSVILHASVLQLLGQGTVVAVDIDIRPHNRAAIEAHPLAHRVRLLEGSSIDPATLDAVRACITEDDRVMVVLDSNHTHEHVLEELRAYGPLVTPGCFLVVADTIVEDLPVQTHRPRPWGPGNNPKTALDAYLQETERFAVDPVNDKLLVTSSPGGYLRCIAP